jgi:uncharacterized protein YecE (DUF72 family)
MTIHIGCSGWHYLHWRGDFYPSGTKSSEFLKLYLEHFDTVEINNSFYRLPTEKAFLSWRDAVPPNFKFSVKANRFITHNKKLKDSGEFFKTFFDRAILLGNRLGPILFQLPPRWKYNGSRLEEFLALLPTGSEYVFEFRNNDWIRDEMFDLLRKYHVGFCIHDMPDIVTPEIVTAKVAYIRFHGNGAKYSGGYSDKMLAHWATRINEWNTNGIDVYVYFNNDIGGFAPRNALTLKSMVNGD